MVVEKLEKTVGEQAAKIDELEKKLKEAQVCIFSMIPFSTQSSYEFQTQVTG